MTDQTPENAQLFLTAPMPCPYLPGMQERIGLIGGEIEIHSTPGAGCEIRVLIPFAAQAS